jgi:TRAP-type C4-dicarboxylate transport system permease small subunit
MTKVLSILDTLFKKMHGNITLVCGIMFFLYMLNIVGDVAGRYLFLSPIFGTIEIGENVLAIAVFMTLAAVEMNKENMRVTLVLDHASAKVKAILDILAIVCGLFLMGFMSWQSFVLAKRSFVINEVGANFPIPLYIGKFAFFIGCILLCIQFVYELIHLIYRTFVAAPSFGDGESD